MRAPLSIVIVTRNAEADLRPCLLALMEGVEAGLVRDLVLADLGSTDGTPALAEAVGARLVAAGPDAAAARAAGRAAATGDWVLHLEARAVPGPGWVEAVERALAARVSGYFRLKLRGGGRLRAIGLNLRAALTGRPLALQGRLEPRRGADGARLERLDAWVEVGHDRLRG